MFSKLQDKGWMDKTDDMSKDDPAHRLPRLYQMNDALPVISFSVHGMVNILLKLNFGLKLNYGTAATTCYRR